jgi:hypothetical protein
MMAEDSTISILLEIRNWIRAASFTSVRSLLEMALPDPQSRLAYQLLDGTATLENVRVVSKMSPNKLVTLTQRWSAMGLMEITSDKKKKRLFDLSDFGLIANEE